MDEIQLNLHRIDFKIFVSVQVKGSQNAGVPQNAGFASNCQLLLRIPDLTKIDSLKRYYKGLCLKH